MLKIDKGLPIPRKRVGVPRNKEVLDTLSILEIGDSVEFPTDGIRHGTRYSRKGNTFKEMARKQGMKLTQRLNEDKSAIRFWRIK